MSDKTGIEWTDATWNPIRGCTRVSEGCRNCYAESVAARFSDPGQPYHGLAERSSKGPRWTSKVAFAGDETLAQPLRWKRPRRIFVNSMSDLFHEGVPDETINRIFAVMALCPQHTFQVLTKRTERMRAYCANLNTARRVGTTICDMTMDMDLDVILIAPGTDQSRAPPGQRVFLGQWPLPNVWLGVSVEDQATADERVPILLATPAAVRWVSAEPLLKPVDFTCLHQDGVVNVDALNGRHGLIAPYRGKNARLDWIVVGGESGPGARPMHPAWARSIRDQCAAASVPFLFKQWGEHVPCITEDNGDSLSCHEDGAQTSAFASEQRFPIIVAHHREFWRVGKKRAGRMLDGVQHDGYPEARP